MTQNLGGTGASSAVGISDLAASRKNTCRRRNQRQEGQSSSPATKAKAPKVQAAEGKVFLEREAGFRDEISLGESVRTRRIIVDTLPCVSITSLNQDVHVAKNADSDTLRLMAEEKVCGKGSVALLKESVQLGCVSHDSHPTKSVLRKEEKWGSKHTVKSHAGNVHVRNASCR